MEMTHNTAREPRERRRTLRGIGTRGSVQHRLTSVNSELTEPDQERDKSLLLCAVRGEFQEKMFPDTRLNKMQDV